MAPKSSLARAVAAVLLPVAAGRVVEYYRYEGNENCTNTGNNVIYVKWDSGGYDYCVAVTEGRVNPKQWSFDMRCEDGNSQITVRQYPEGNTACSGSERTEYSAPTEVCLSKSSEHEWIPEGESEFWLCKEDNPCFGRETSHACKLTDAAATATAAFDACFGSGGNGGNSGNGGDGELVSVAHRVLMSELRAGDLVLSEAGGAAAVTRVIANQHVHTQLSSRLLLLRHAEGTLALTPDHVLTLDGEFRPARLAVRGSRLTKADGTHIEVEAVTASRGGIINPITADGKILAADATGVPVVAATANEWLADVLLSTYPQHTLSFALAGRFPSLTQAYYDAWLEPFFNAAVPRLSALKTAAPAPAVAAGIVIGDAMLSVGLAAYALCRIEVAIALGAVYSFARAAKAARKG